MNMNRAIMVVDDEENISRMLGIFLRRLGYDVISVTDPLTVESRLEAITPALFIIDYMMPGLNGVELANRLRQHPECKHTPMFMLTALADPRILREAMDADFDNYFTKGEMTNRLIDEIDKLFHAGV